MNVPPLLMFSALVLMLQLLPNSITGTKIKHPSSYKYDIEALSVRESQWPVHPMIRGRRSLRHMTGQSISHEELMSLFEAARWAPSLRNIQPTRFVYIHRRSPNWSQWLASLAEGNQIWARDGAVLVAVLSARYHTYKQVRRPVPMPSFDAGAACLAMALEGTARGLVVHDTGGFDQTTVARLVGLNETSAIEQYNVETVIIIGRRAYGSGNAEVTSQREPLDRLVFEEVLVEK